MRSWKTFLSGRVSAEAKPPVARAPRAWGWLRLSRVRGDSMGLLIRWPASRFFFCFSNATSPCPKERKQKQGSAVATKPNFPPSSLPEALDQNGRNGPTRWAQPISNMSRSLAVCHDSAGGWGSINLLFQNATPGRRLLKVRMPASADRVPSPPR